MIMNRKGITALFERYIGRLRIAPVLLLCLLFPLTAYGTAPAETEAKEWTRQGYFADDDGNMLSVTWMEDTDEPGWYVGIMMGETMAGWTIPREGDTLHGNLYAWDESAEPLIVTVSEEGEDGLLLAVDGDKSYHFKPYEIPDAAIVVTINTEGLGDIAYAEGEEAPEIDQEYPSQSAYIGLDEPATYTFIAQPQAGYLFQKWTKNGEDYSTDPQITLPLDESADYIAVFGEDLDWQNPVMNFVGAYQNDRTRATVECLGYDEASISIEWEKSASEMTNWVISGRLDTETLRVAYEGCSKTNFVYDKSGETTSDDSEYEDIPGVITFNGDGTFTWHRELPEGEEDMVFEWAGVQ